MKLVKKSKLVAKHTFGGFTVRVHFDEKNPKGCYATVSTESGIWGTKLTCGCAGYDYLLKTSLVDDWPSLEAWVCINYSVSAYAGSDQAFAVDLIEAINAYVGRMDASAAAAASRATEAENAEADAFMRDAIAYGDMSDEERGKRKEEMRKEFIEVLRSEDGEV